MLGSGPGSPLSRRGRRSSRPVGRRDEIESGSRVAEEQRGGASRSAVRITANFRRGRSAALVVALAVMAAGESRACGRIEAQGTRAEPASPWAAAAESGAAEGAGAGREELEPEPIPGAAVQLETGGASLGIIRLEARDKGRAPAGGAAPMIGLSPERARLLLRSLTVPGWAQATGGRRTAAAAFGLAELSIWTSFTAFRIQSQLRRDSYERTARLFAGVDLHGRDEEFRRIIGSYLSSDEYNQLVVYREAANLYYSDPAAYRAYIAQHSIGGTDAWSWDSDGSLLRYRAQRKDAQRAAIRANTALACAVVNRLLSMIHAARVPAHPAAAPRSWNFEVTPAPDGDALACRMGVRASF